VSPRRTASEVLRAARAATRADDARSLTNDELLALVLSDEGTDDATALRRAQDFLTRHGLAALGRCDAATLGADFGNSTGTRIAAAFVLAARAAERLACANNPGNSGPASAPANDNARAR